MKNGGKWNVHGRTGVFQSVTAIFAALAVLWQAVGGCCLLHTHHPSHTCTQVTPADVVTEPVHNHANCTHNHGHHGPTSSSTQEEDHRGPVEQPTDQSAPDPHDETLPCVKCALTTPATAPSLASWDVSLRYLPALGTTLSDPATCLRTCCQRADISSCIGTLRPHLALCIMLL